MDAKPLAASAKLTPTDIKNKDFKRKVMGGYDPKEVVEFLDATAKAWEKVQRNEKDLLEKILALTEEVQKWRGKENEFLEERNRIIAEAEEIKVKAMEEAKAIYNEVEERVSGIRRKTEEWLEMVIAQVEETERQKRNFVTALRSSLDSHYELLQREEEPLDVQLNSFLKKALSGETPSLPS